MGEQFPEQFREQSLPARPKLALGPSIFVKMGSSILERSHQLEKGSTNKFHTFRVCKAGPVTVPQTSLNCVTFHVSVNSWRFMLVVVPIPLGIIPLGISQATIGFIVFIWLSTLDLHRLKISCVFCLKRALFWRVDLQK